MTEENMTASGWRVGIDVIEIAEVAGSVARFGERYLRRVYTERELEACQTTSGLNVTRLATYFAAKEATIKALQPIEMRPDFTSIEVLDSRQGRPGLRLSGAAARYAADADIEDLSASLTRAGGIAGAVVVATCREPLPTATVMTKEEVTRWTT